MKRLIFSTILAIIGNFCCAANQTDSLIITQSNDKESLDKRQHRSRDGWARIIPTHIKVQYAGNMGLISGGVGWDYGKKSQWESDIFFGIVPKYNSQKSHLTMTLKQNYIPWRVSVTDWFSIDPFYTGVYINAIFGEEFWSHQPERYPSGYYWFSTRFHTHIFAGVRVSLHPIRKEPAIRDITLFFEVSACDLYIIQRVRNREIQSRDIIAFSAGIKFQIF